MLQIFKRDWPLKLLSLVGAVILAVVVSRQQDRTRTRILRSLQVTPPAGLQVVQPRGEVEIRVDVDGPGDLIRDLDASEVQVSFDLSGAAPGSQLQAPVRVSLPAAIAGRVSWEWLPRTIPVRLVAEQRRELPVYVQVSRQVPGWAWKERPTTSPSRALVYGTQASLEQVDRIGAMLVTPDREVVSVPVALLPLDRRGAVLADVRVEPQEALVSGMQQRVVIQKRVPVQPSFVAPPGVRVSVEVQPAFVLLTGPEQLLSRVYTVDTELITLDRKATQVSRDVGILPPDPALRISPEKVHVTLRQIGATRRP